MVWRENRELWKGDLSPLEETTQRLSAFLKRSGGPWIILLVIAAIWIGTTCFYKVEVEEVGVVQRFGKYMRAIGPGLHLKLPFGIERVTKVPVRKVFTEEFGLRTIRPGIRTEYAPARAYQQESLMLTGDLNVAIVPWIVQYRIQDPYDYLFKVRNVRETLRDLSEAIVRQVVGDRSINEVINKRKEIADEAKVQLQRALDDAETGLKIINLELKTTNVPEPVQPSFNDVNKATQDKQKMIREAEARYNKAIPAAEGEARKIIQEAIGYKIERINRANGDVARFLAILKEYQRAKDITRRRLYLESMAKVLPKVGNKYVVDSREVGILPLLELTRKGEVK